MSRQLERGQSGALIKISDFDAVLFDMDGVVTRTAAVHYQAWKKVFDELIKRQASADQKPFDQQDYLSCVDGKPRENGVRDFLQDRKITIPEGNADDEPGFNSVVAISKLKDQEFLNLIHTNGVEPYETTVSVIKHLREAGIKTGLVTASRNGAEILKVTNLSHLFDATVTGVEAAELNLRGKPAPDVFLHAAQLLGVRPSRAAVVEDAEAGVEAGKNGRFAMVIGIARQDNFDALKKHGAAVVVRDMAEVKVEGVRGAAVNSMALAESDVTDANWIVEYDKYDATHELQRESLCSLGNGKFCTRGSWLGTTADANHYPGTYVAGAYNSIMLEADGDRFEREELVNMPNWLCLNFRVADGDWFSIDKVEILHYKQRLDLREGILFRELKFRSSDGKETFISERRFVHMQYSHLCGTELKITPLNWSGNLTISNGLDASVTNQNDVIDPRFERLKHLEVLQKDFDEGITSLKVITSGSRIVVAQSARTTFSIGGNSSNGKRSESNGKTGTHGKAATHDNTDHELYIETKNVTQDEYVGQELSMQVAANESVTVQKVCAIYTSRDGGIYEPGFAAHQAAKDAPDFEFLVEHQKSAWRCLWNQFDLFIETSEEHSKLVPSRLLHLNSFHCMQTASRHTIDLDCSVPARGWTGEGYQGHVFWDDLFVFPFINLRMPDISAALLQYRYRRLPAARKIAEFFGAKGACFPWQSASDGRERTPDYWWLAGSKKWIRDYTRREIHVNGAIAYNVWQYFQVTEHTEFMYSYGSELLLEIARFFASYAQYNEARGKYELHRVIGPDEFHNAYPDSEEPGLNNNAYTNIMAAWSISRAIELLQTVPSAHSTHIRTRLRISDEELELWDRVRKNMYVPIMENGVIEQFEGYASLEEFPGFDANGQLNHDEFVRLFNENDGYLNQYKIAKQGDVLMLGFLFSPDELRDIFRSLGLPEEACDLRKMAEYYLPRTANQSTLSRVATVWVLSRVMQLGGNSCEELKKTAERETQIFYEALGSDYFDVASRGTTRSGIHMGAMAGTVDIVQRCYTGIVTRKGVLWLQPALPEPLLRLSFSILYRGQQLTFDIHKDQFQVHAHHSSAQPVKIGYKDQVYELNSGDTKIFRAS